MNIDLKFQDWALVLQRANVRQYDDRAHTLRVTGDLPAGWRWTMYLSVFSEAYFNAVALTESDGALTAVLTRGDLAFGDTAYTLQLVGTKDDVRRHTNPVRLYVGASLSGDGVWPEVPRSFTDAETAALAAAARACAAADAAEETARGALRYDAAQTLSDAQKEQARLNIEAVSENTFSMLEMDVENVKTAAYAHIDDASAHVSAADRARWNASGGGAVASVNGKTGAVTLYAHDVGAASAEESAALSSRLDNAVAAVSADSEVQDIRVASDGTVCPSAGTAVRSQFDALNALTVKTESRNLWNPDDPDFGAGVRLWADGGISAGNYDTSGYLRVHPGDVLYATYLSDVAVSGVWVAYDALKTMVAGSGVNGASTYTVPSGAAFVRFCIYKSYSKLVQVEAGGITRYAPYSAPVTQLDRTKLTRASAPLNLLPTIIRDYVCYRGSLMSSAGGYVTTLIEIPDGATKLFMRSSTDAGFSSAQYFDETQTYLEGSVTNINLSNARSVVLNPAAKFIRLSGTGWSDAYDGDIRLAFDEDSFLLLDHGYTDRADGALAYDAVSLWGKREYPRTFFTAVAHRGFTPIAPENTIPALLAARRYGFDCCEFDVQFTLDHVPVLLHNRSINDTARNADGSAISGTVNITDITLAQARTYDFGIAYSAKYAGTQIPTFEEALRVCRNIGLHPHVEIKAESAPAQSDIETLVNMVRGMNMTGHVTWVSTAVTQLQRIHTLLPKAELGLIVTTVDQTKIDSILALQDENSVFLSTTDYGAAAIALCKASCLPVMAWTPDTEAEILALDAYVSGATSNRLHAGFTLYSRNMAD